MTLTCEAIVDGLIGLLGAEKVDTDEQTLKENSLDRYRKLEDIFGIYNLPIPAAVVRVASTDDVSKTLAFFGCLNPPLSMAYAFAPSFSIGGRL